MELPDNPILVGCYPDPSVCRVGDDYYLVTSTFEYFPGLPVFHSTDLVEWTQLGHALDRTNQLDLSTVPSSGGLFAPTIRHHEGTWYIACTLVHGEGRQGNFVLTADDPAGPWSDPTWIDGADGIDPSLFFDTDGRLWMCGTRLSATPLWHDQTDVWLRELDPVTLDVVGNEILLWHGALEGAIWAEGPHLYRRNGWYYLLASEGGTEFDHALSVARSRSVDGPYIGHTANPVLTHRTLGHAHPVSAVGHADLGETADGEWFAVLLASRPYGGGYHANLGRETYIVAVEWENDWPVFAPGVGQVRATAPEESPEPRMPTPLEWTQVRTADSGFATVDQAAGAVTLEARPGPFSRVATPAFIGVRQRHKSVAFRATLDTATLVGPPTPSTAGLAARQSESAHLMLTVTGGAEAAAAVALRTTGGASEVIGRVPLEEGPVTLEIRAELQDYRLWVETGGRRVLVASVDGRFLSSQVAGGFLGVWLGLVAMGDPAQLVEFTGITYGRAIDG